MAGEYDQERGTGPVASMLRAVRKHPYTGPLVNIAPSAALARALITEPTVLLLDEPLGWDASNCVVLTR